MWTSSENDFLIKKFSEMSDKDIALSLNKTIKSVQSRARRLNLIKSKNYVSLINKNRVQNRWLDRLWTKEQIDFLTSNINRMNNEEISNVLKKSKNSIVSMCMRLDIKRDKKYNEESIKKQCSKYVTKNELRLSDPNLYAWLFKKGKLDEYTKHMLKTSYSTPQLILKYIMSKITNSKLNYNDRKAINPYEIDIYFPEYKFGIEYDGAYYHQNENDIKFKLCLSNKINLITINEKELVRRNFESYVENIKNQLIKNLVSINTFLKLNITKGEIFNIYIDKSAVFKGIFDIVQMKEICDKYKNYTNFIKYEKSCYNKLYYLGLLKDFTKHMNVEKL